MTADPQYSEGVVEKMSEASETQAPTTGERRTNHNVVGIDGKDYRIEGQCVNKAFVKDMMEMAGDDFVKKYGLEELMDSGENVEESK